MKAIGLNDANPDHIIRLSIEMGIRLQTCLSTPNMLIKLPHKGWDTNSFHSLQDVQKPLQRGVS